MEKGIKALRQLIDECIYHTEKFEEKTFDKYNGKNMDSIVEETRALGLVKIKLQEAKMWCGKVLEAQGSKLPNQFRDHCDKRSTENSSKTEQNTLKEVNEEISRLENFLKLGSLLKMLSKMI